jgi:hypothetical protein
MMKCYPIPKHFWPWMIVPLLMFAFSFVLLIVGLAYLFFWIAGIPLIHIGDLGVEDSPGLLISGCILNVLSGSLSNMTTDVCVDSQGLYVRAFVIKRLFVPWEDLIDVKISQVYDQHREFIWVVQVKKLTFWHKCIGSSYKGEWVPSFLITSDLDGYEELRRTILAHLEPQNGE